MVYDQARALADSLKRSEEYTAYKALKDRLFESEANKALYKEYKQLQFKAQAAIMTGQADEELQQQAQRITDIMQLNNDMVAFLQAEYRFHQVMGDIYKILGDAVDVDLSFLEG